MSTAITQANVIDVILKAIKYEDIFPVDGDVSYKGLMKWVHPDLNKDPRATDASAKLAKLVKDHTVGLTFTDDSGNYLCNYHWANYCGNLSVVDQGRKMQKKVLSTSTMQLKRYMPYSWEDDYKIVFLDRALPLSGLTLPQDHVNWVVSRLLEFCMLVHHHTGTAHLGLTPDNIFIVPETHGVSVSGFYHATKLGDRMQTISAKYKSWYPASALASKKASEYVDIQMVKRIGAYLLGDRSGLGNKLIRTHNKDFVAFLTSYHDNSRDAFKAYREMIDKNFAKQFIHLNI